MPTSFDSLATAFVLAFGFVCSVLVFLPIPGLQQMPSTPKAAFALTLTCCLLPSWIPPPGSQLAFDSAFLAALTRDCLLGITTGLMVGFLTESITIMAQLAATQAGFNYATTIDPSNQVDTGTLQVVGTLLAGLLFFNLELDHRFLIGLSEYVRNQQRLDAAAMTPMIIDGLTTAFRTAIQLSLPVTALLLLVDLSLAFAGRMQAQLQLLPLTLPLKVLACLLIVAMVLRNVLPAYEHLAQALLRELRSGR